MHFEDVIDSLTLDHKIWHPRFIKTIIVGSSYELKTTDDSRLDDVEKDLTGRGLLLEGELIPAVFYEVAQGLSCIVVGLFVMRYYLLLRIKLLTNITNNCNVQFYY